MLSPKSYEFVDETSKAKVPFSWEVKPGVSKRHNKTEDEVEKWKLTPPPCHHHAEYNYNEVLQTPLVVFPLKSNSNKLIKSSRSNSSSFRKREEDPFLEAYAKCLELSPMRVSSLRTSVRADHDSYVKSNKKSRLLWLWLKYSCKLGIVSRFLSPKSNQRINFSE